MAELLGFPHATIIMEVEKQEGAIRVKRELENGWFQWIGLPMPAVLTIQSGIRRLRYATLMGIKRAKTKEIRTVMPADLAVDRQPAAVIERVYLPKREKHTQILQGAPKEAAQQLVEKLRFEVRAI
jgi:electron transfer flavoprotein beta subunit